ncbi:MAG: FAD-binding protein [Mycobacterium sp.]
MWDIEVDIACIGSGVGALANAIATVDAGGEVLVVDSAAPSRGDKSATALRERVHAGRGWLVDDTRDIETNEYLAAVVEGVLDARASLSTYDIDGAVPLRDARNLSTEEAHGPTAETFYGARLNAWAAQCLTSPYGLLYSSMRDWRTTSMRSSSGESIEVTSIGEAPWGDGFGQADLRHWVTNQAQEREIEVRTSCALDRIVFEDGVIVGVVLSTPDGPCAVRTRAGLTLAPRVQDPMLDVHANSGADRPKQVCLVGRTASRFGRVELLDTVPAAATRPICTGSRRQFRAGMHDTRQPSLEGWRCGNVHGHPAFGQ